LTNLEKLLTGWQAERDGIRKAIDSGFIAVEGMYALMNQADSLARLVETLGNLIGFVPIGNSKKGDEAVIAADKLIAEIEGKQDA